MKIKRQGMIMGHAALFAASVIGCESGSDDDGGTADAQPNIPRDASQTDIDVTTMDASSGIADMTVAPDTALPASDMATPGPVDQGGLPDVSPFMDMAIIALDEGAPRDASIAADAVVVEDAAPCIDAAVPDIGPVSVCDEFRGQRCQNPDQGCCDNNQPVLVCRGGALVEPGPDDFACGCATSDGLSQVFCAVPGFVGIAKAGRLRKKARRLRDLIV